MVHQFHVMNLSENEKYHADTTRISKSGLDKINQAPAKYWHHYLNPNKPPQKRTDALIAGSVFHTLTTEPHLFKNEFVTHLPFTGDGAQTRQRELQEMNPGKTLISISTYEQCSRMRDAVLAHPIAQNLFDDGFAERIFKWTDQTTGAKCKIKPDWHNPKRRITVDLKSTDNASLEKFKRSAFKYRYHVQSSFYLDGLKNNGIPSDAFVFVAVEKEPPYLVNVFYSPNTAIVYGREQYLDDLFTYVQCLKNNEWPGYGTEIMPLDLPGFIKL